MIYIYICHFAYVKYLVKSLNSSTVFAYVFICSYKFFRQALKEQLQGVVFIEILPNKFLYLRVSETSRITHKYTLKLNRIKPLFILQLSIFMYVGIKNIFRL